MTINVTEKENNTVVVAPVGNLDYITSEELEEVVTSVSKKADKLILDLGSIDYVASAGLRVILNADDLMSEKGGLVLSNVNDYVMNILKMTDFVNILTFE